MTPLPIKKTDSKGRLTLGPEYADKQFFVNRKDDSVIQLIPAETVPAREAWLFKNGKALLSVMRGLEQAAAGDVTEGPDVAADIAAFGDSGGR
jgi:hypothetical protein